MKLTEEQHDFIWTRDRGRCIWTHCGAPAKEIMHFHSKGAGGRPSANDLTNMGLGCYKHARHSDGERYGGETAFTNSMLDLFGADFLMIPQDRIAYERAEKLTRIVADG